MAQHKDRFSDLEAIVEATATAIRAGDLRAMGDLALQTEIALTSLEAQADPARLTKLRELAKRNAIGLEAATKGVRAARRRLADVMRASGGTQTYDVAGKTFKIGHPENAINARL